MNTERKKLLYVANLKMPTHKAYGIQISKNCEAFAHYGLDVELVVPQRPTIPTDFFQFYGVEPIYKFTVLPAANPEASGFLEKYFVIFKEFISAWHLARYARKVKSDYIVSRDPYTLFLLSFFRKNLIHTLLEVHRFSGFRRKFYSRIVKKGGYIVTTTKNLKEKLTHSGIPSEYITVVPNGVDLKMFDNNMSREEARNESRLPITKKIILYSGNLYDWKGVKTLEKAHEYMDSELMLFLLKGKPYKNVPLYLKSADVLVLPNSAKSEESLLYTSPLKMFEYMAARRPIVASHLPSILEILNHHNAILVEPDNPKALAEGIMKALAGGPEIEALTEQAYRDVQQYSLSERAKKIISLIDHG